MESLRMAQRAATFARRPSGSRAAERARSASDPAGAPVTLDLKPLIAPYKRNRALTIRVERLLHGARLTQGRNNGDRSWSLFPDDLAELEYLPATASYDAHTLAVRIISLDGGDGETLAVIDLPIEGVAPAEVAKPEFAAPANAEDVAQLREQLDQTTASLAARETELARTASSLAAREAELSRATSFLAARDAEFSAARAHVQETKNSRTAPEAELAAAKQAWERELQNRLSISAAESSVALEKARAEWKAELERVTQSLTARDAELSTARKLAADAEKSRISPKAELAAARQAWERELQNRLSAAAAESETALQKARADWEAEQGSRLSRSEAGAQRAVEEARRRARDEMDAALSKARAEWKAGEAARFGAAEAVWRQESSSTVADLSARAETAEKALAEANTALSLSRTNESQELRRLREQLAQAEADLATRGAELTAARAATELASKAGQDAAAELRKAEQARKSTEAARLASVEARWKQQSEKAVAELTTQLEQTEKALAETRAQAEARLHQISMGQTTLKAREAELEELRSASEKERLELGSEVDAARARWQQEMQTALAKAQDEWKSAEAGRFAAAEAQWNAQLATVTAGGTVEVQDLQGTLLQTQLELQTLHDSSVRDRRRLRDELAAAQISLAARENDLAAARMLAEQASATADKSSNGVAAEIEKARQTWQQEADEALAQARTAWVAEEQPRIAAAIAEKLKFAPDEALTEASEKLGRAEAALADANTCTNALRQELAAAQSSLSERELELAEARAMIGQEHDRLKQAPISTPERKPRWEVDEEERRAHFRKRLIRDLAIVCCLAGLGFIAYPRVQPVVAESLPQSLSFNSQLQPLLQMAGLSRPPPAAPIVEPRAYIGVRVANLRSTPSTGGPVVTRLARNMEVTTVDRRGEWVFVRVGEGANQHQGWVASSVLKDVASADKTGTE
jgi:hypothetical protein